ncbi:MAG: hypothetical protein WDN50_11265 [Bradyrhizobium sp.]
MAGVQDARFQQLMPDVIHWLGLKRIDRFVSMSDMKHDRADAARASRSWNACRSPTNWCRPTRMWKSPPRRPQVTTRRNRHSRRT